MYKRRRWASWDDARRCTVSIKTYRRYVRQRGWGRDFVFFLPAIVPDNVCRGLFSFRFIHTPRVRNRLCPKFAGRLKRPRNYHRDSPTNPFRRNTRKSFLPAREYDWTLSESVACPGHTFTGRYVNEYFVLDGVNRSSIVKGTVLWTGFFRGRIATYAESFNVSADDLNRCTVKRNRRWDNRPTIASRRLRVVRYRFNYRYAFPTRTTFRIFSPDAV